jgi:zinc protease
MSRVSFVLCALALAACGGATSQQPPATTPGSGTTVEIERVAVPAKAPPPASGTRTEARFPAIARAQTASGLELNTVPLHQLPIVTIKLVVRGGSASDPEGMPGVAQLTASMLKEGTYKKSSAKLAEAVDFLGAQLGVGSGHDTLVIHFQALAEHFDTALDLIAEIALQPAFAQDELDKLKKRELARLSLQSQDPHFLAARELRKALYGKHPYASVDTTPAVVRKIKRQDLMRWHKRAFTPGNAFLVVTGDVTPERVQAGADRAFAKWTGKSAALAPSVEPPVATQRSVVIVDRPESVQSMIYYGNLALPRADKDFIPLTVANQVLGGSASSRLFMDLREKRSLTYGAYSDVDELVQIGPFAASAAVRTEVTAEAIAAFTEHLERITKEKVGQAEISDAKRYLTDRFPLRIDTAGKIASLVVELRQFGLPDSYWDSFRDAIEGVSPEAALAAAQRYIRPAQSTLVVVGKAAAFKPALDAYGPVTVVDTDGNIVVQPKTAAAPAPAAASAAPAAPSPAKAPPAKPSPQQTPGASAPSVPPQVPPAAPASAPAQPVAPAK